MSSPFLNGGGSNITFESLQNGSANIKIYSVSVGNLASNFPVMTNDNKELYSSLIPINKVDGLQSELDSKLSNPLTSDLTTRNIEPSVGGLYDCGSDTYQWANVNTQFINADGLKSFSGGNINLYNSIDATAPNVSNIGSTTNYLNTIYTQNLIPGTNGTGNIGAVGPNRFFNNIYCNNYNSTGAMTLSTGPSGVLPYADNAIPLGSDTRNFTNLYTNAITLNTVDLNTRLTTNETNISNNTTAISGKVSKSGDTFTGPMVFGVGSSIDFNGQTLNNVYNVTHQGPGRITFFNCGLIPAIDNERTLGEPSNKWSNVYATDFNLNGSSVSTSLSNKLNTTAQTTLNMNNNNITNAGNINATSITTPTINNATGINLQYNGTTKLATTNTGIQMGGTTYNSTTNTLSVAGGGFNLICPSVLILNGSVTRFTRGIDCETDNTYDIGSAAFNRFRSAYLATSIVSPLIDSTTASLQIGNTAPVFIPSKSYSHMSQASQTYAVTASTWRLANNTSTSVFQQGFTNTPGQFRTQYTGTRSRTALIDFNISCSSNVANTNISLFVSINGNLIPGSLHLSRNNLGTINTIYNMSHFDMLTINTGDTIQMALLSDTTGSITFSSASLTITCELN